MLLKVTKVVIVTIPTETYPKNVTHKLTACFLMYSTYRVRIKTFNIIPGYYRVLLSGYYVIKASNYKEEVEVLSLVPI